MLYMLLLCVSYSSHIRRLAFRSTRRLSTPRGALRSVQAYGSRLIVKERKIRVIRASAGESVELTGIEPATSCLQSRRSPS